MIKALLFDYGGVIADDRSGDHLYQQLGASLGISAKVAWELLAPLWLKLSRGKITENALWEELERQYGQPILESQRAVWNDWDSMPRHQEMLDFVAELKEVGYITGIISTTIARTAEDIRAHGGYNFFDPVILSYEVGYAKPDPEIYRIAMEYLSGIRPTEVIFLDDRTICLPPAQALGIHTVLVENSNQAITATKGLLAANQQPVQ